jgi:group I intron endonuclease
MASGVYFIRHRESGKMYVGIATRIDHRLKTHQWKLERGESHNSRLAAAFKHSGGWDAFETGILEECPVEFLEAREQHRVNTLKPGYNIRYVVTSNRGAVFSAEAVTRKRAWASEPANKELLAERLAYGRKVRWEAPGAAERQSEMMSAVRAKKRRTQEDIEAMIAAASPHWMLQSLAGTKTKDKITIHCAKHDAVHSVTVNMLVSRQQGCRACGFERSSEKQKGIVKPSLVARWDRQGRKTDADLKAWKRDYDRSYRLRPKGVVMAKRVYEGSPADIKKDKAGARKMGVSMKAYEKTPRDRAEDKAGQRQMYGKRK